MLKKAILILLFCEVEILGVWKPLRKLYFKATDFTHGIQGQEEKILDFYKLWAFCYDFTVNLDPAYSREMKKMIDSVVKQDDIVLDIGCGTGLGTIYAAKIAEKVIGVDISSDMVEKLKKKIYRKDIKNIDLIVGKFPESISRNIKFNSIISSFTIVHLTKQQRKTFYKHIFDYLVNKGVLGLFSAQGEFASSFETKNEIIDNLKSAGCQQFKIDDVSDAYRIVRAEKIEKA
ncbi:class I SAM-dependent methyltransferase [bacterium]|nr:class I SAM-dependent methyltransferase [bacterium]MBU2462092.1 class I SAM-dependent methyltransferase [bacterium]